MRNTQFRTKNMARKTGKGGKFRNVHCRTWNMARKLKIKENENNTRYVVKPVSKHMNDGWDN